MVEALRQRALAAGLAIVLCSGVFGCAYFNLFYNAEHAFQEAEDLGKGIDPRNQPTGAQKTKYRVCIQKCELMLEEYPDSDYIDDTMFYMGKSYYRLKEVKNYRLAINNFDRMLANFPQSEFRAEALYLKSLAHLAVGEEQVALDNLARLRASEEGGKFAAEALYQLGDTYAAKEEHATAIQYFQQFLAEYPKHEESATVGLHLAQSQAFIEDYAAVVATVEKLNRGRATRRERFEADLLRARALNDVGRSDEAAKLVDAIAGDAEFFEQRPATLLLQGEVELKRGNEKKGLTILESLALEFERKPSESDARLAKAQYFLEAAGPADPRLSKELDTAMDHNVSGKSGEAIRELRKEIQRYNVLRKEIAETDSVSVRASFALAELLLAELERPREALGYYQQALAAAPAQGAIGPRAAFAIGHIYTNYLDRSDSAAMAHAQLRERFPDSPQARSLDGELFLAAKPRSAEEIAAILARAESGGGASDRRPGNGASAGSGDGSGMRAGDTRPRSLARGGPGATMPRDGARH